MSLSINTLKIGGRYNWKNQAERLVYTGMCEPRNGYWHQFERVDEPGVVWCEVLTRDLAMLEETQPAVPAATPAGEQAAPLVASPDEREAEAIRLMHAYGTARYRLGQHHGVERPEWDETPEPDARPAFNALLELFRAILATTEAPREPEAALDASNVIWLIYYDDYDRRPEIVQGEAGARARFARISDNWNAHLFVKVESNSRDDRHANNNIRLASALVNPAAPQTSVPTAAPFSEPRATGDGELPARAGDARDTIIERLIEDSDGHWKEDVFCIGGPELMALLHATLASTPAAPLQAEPHPDTKEKP